jgi:hypothetical protein
VPVYRLFVFETFKVLITVVDGNVATPDKCHLLIKRQLNFAHQTPLNKSPPEDDDCVESSRLGEGRREQVEKAGEGEAGRVDAPTVEIVVDDECEQGAEHGAHRQDQVDERLDVVAPGEGAVRHRRQPARLERAGLKYLKALLSASEAVHFCAAPAPAPACQKFRLRLHAPASSPIIFPIYFRKKSKMSWFQKKCHAFYNKK